MEVVYRLGTIHLLATGLLLADSGGFIFVKQHLDQEGAFKTFYLKIRYHCILRLSEISPDSMTSGPRDERESFRPRGSASVR